MTIVPEQPVIEASPYRLIRHPSSTGLLIMFLGFGLSYTNWLSLLALMGCALFGLSYRIHVEEHVLQEPRYASKICICTRMDVYLL